uniref:7TM_GPCR_Srx domain-containing protein n=1 Tax=Haemonchus placei TaxID=6290 RepID=A0A0N4X937_HAEPC
LDNAFRFIFFCQGWVIWACLHVFFYSTDSLFVEINGAFSQKMKM